MARKILLADDSVTAQNMGRKILADAGYEVITVNNGSAALKKIAEHRPDLIVLDVYMPGYSGLEVCQRLKEVAETSRIPVMLTVGKLEPFKPEEAKRVRADGFIVKPFEASELLSALSKLEDKIVPRAESSKPGRLARATAAIDEGRYDKSVAVEEDSGWKNRIAFPSKKKASAPEQDSDDAAIYNPVNKDLRTVIDHKPAEAPKALEEEELVDVGALAPEGLPKDVTPEEIAALAAAAAQMQGKIAESKAAESKHDAPSPESVEAKEPIVPTPLADSSPEVAAVPAPVPSFAEQKPQETVQAQAIPDEPSKEGSPAAATPDLSSPVLGAEHETEPFHSSDEPVTMAVAAAASASSAASRWTAVAVALGPEESSISLEQEMQKAHAAFVAESNAHAPVAMEPVAEVVPETAASFSVEAPTSEPTLSVPAAAAPEAVQALSEVANAAAEAIGSAVKELEAVAASVASAQSVVSPEPFSAPTPELPAPRASEVPTVAETIADTRVPALKDEPALAVVSESLPEEPEKQESVAAKAADLASEESKAATADCEPTADCALASVNEPATLNTIEPAVAEIAAPPSIEPAPNVRSEGSNKEPDIAATTAAAWASWRRIRESGNGSAPRPGDADAASSHEPAAMAAAAGAEKHPDEISSADDSDPAIASIVDSVLAGLRPKIFEEVSRKLGKKK